MKRYALTTLALLLVISTSVYAQKVEVIEDEFNGTKYYQTKGFNFARGAGYWIETRFKTRNGDTNIYLQVSLGTDSTFLVGDENTISIKFEDGTLLSLEYEQSVSTRRNNFGFVGSEGQHLRASGLVDTIGTATMIRAETKGEFNNMKVSKGSAKKLLKAYENIKKAIDADSEE